MKALTRPFHTVFQKAALGLSLRDLERRTGIKGLKQAFFDAAELEKNNPAPKRHEEICAVLGKAEDGNESSALLVYGHFNEGNWASNPSYSITIRSLDFVNDRVVTAMSEMSFYTNAFGRFELGCTGIGTNANGSLITAQHKSPEIEAFEKIIFKHFKPR